MEDLFKEIILVNKKSLERQQELSDASQRIGAALRSARAGMKLSLREMARRLKVSATFLSEIERGKKKISPAFFKKLKKLVV